MLRRAVAIAAMSTLRACAECNENTTTTCQQRVDEALKASTALMDTNADAMAAYDGYHGGGDSGID